jgi:hypothetical protein
MARFVLAAASCLLLAQFAGACSVPVFRYALEQWPAARYELLVFHDRPLSQEERETVRQIERSSTLANVTIRQVNLAGEANGDLRSIWNRDGKGAALPRLVLRYPESTPAMPSVWSASLSPESTAKLIASPARRAIYDHLTAGNAGVVVLLLSGDAAADDSAREMLRTQLPAIAGRIELPAKSDEGPQVQSLIPLHIRFPVVEVRRGLAEELLVQILVGSEDGLDKVRGPIAFPIFGRGRALCSLHGADLAKPAELRHSLDFLCRACSCQVKELNPGIDLLIAGDWETIFAAEPGPMPRIATVPGIETRPGPMGEANALELRSPPPAGYSAVEVVDELRPKRGPRWSRLGLLGAAGLAAVVGLFVLRRRPPNRPAS